MKAVVMAGGEGTRLRPLTSNQPKPMVPIVGKPCMEHILELLGRHGFDDVIVTLAFMPQAIRSYFGDGESLGPLDRVLGRGVAAGHGRLGAARLRQARRHRPRHLRRRALRHRPRRSWSTSTSERGAAVTIGLKAVENPLEFGIVVTDEDGRIERFLEKPSWGQVFSDTINTGIYVLEPEVLKHVPTDRPYDFSKELFPLLLEMGRPLYGMVCDGYWQDIGNLDQYRQANFDALDGHARPERPGPAAAREHLDRRGRRDRRPRGRRGAGVRRQLLPDLAAGVDRPLLGAVRERHPARARAHRPLGDRRQHPRRPERARRGRDRRPQLRHPLARAYPGGRRDRRRGRPRRAEPCAPGRPDLPVQGGRVRRAHPREPDLGVAGDLGAVRQGRRHRPDRRRPDPRRGGPARGRARDRAEAGREGRRQPRGARGRAARSSGR